MSKLLGTALLLAAVSVVAGFGPAGYSCDPAVCVAPACMCPSISAPGGLAPADTPQFVLITHDDAIVGTADAAMRGITDPHKNPNGCNVPATWFVTQQGTDCALAKALWEQNHEMALHTITHAELSMAMPQATMTKEILGPRDFLETCGIPVAEMIGYRPPYLIHNPKYRQTLADNAILYDSAIIEYVGPLSNTTLSFAERLWPYTMDNGIVQNVNWTYPAGQGTPDERYPGMWQIPMWDLPNATIDTERNAFTMDPEGGFGGDLYTLLSTNFDQAYNGNRAPFPVYLHMPWFTPEKTAATNKFIEYALSKPNVHFVTMTQLIKWMQNPVPASQVGAALTCKAVTIEAPAPPAPCRVYTVVKDDYPDLIAGKFAVGLPELLAVNPNLDSKNVLIGDKIKIPPFPASCGAGTPIGSTSTPTPAPAPVVPTPAPAPVVPAPAPAPVVPPPPVLQPNGGSPTQPPPSNRVEVDYILAGMTVEKFNAEGKSQSAAALSSVMGVPAAEIALTAAPYARRRRAMLQAAASVKVKAVVGAADPVALYTTTNAAVIDGSLNTALVAQGLQPTGEPVVTAYQGNAMLQINPPAPVENNGVPAGEKAPPAEGSSGLSTGAIIGIAVGGGVVALAVVGALVATIVRRRRKTTDQESPSYSQVEGAAGMKMQAGSQKKPEDPYAVRG